MLTNAIFLILTLLIISFAVAVVACKNPIYSVFCLILVFTYVSILLLNIGAEFLAFILLIVYAGAISILFLFVVLLLNIKVQATDSAMTTAEVYITAAVFLKASIVLLAPTATTEFLVNAFGQLHQYDTVVNLWDMWQTVLADIYIYATSLYTVYFIFPILAGLILLVAMVGAITLTKK